MNGYFRRQLAIYGLYHGDTRNCAAHWLGIPLILFSVLLVLGLWPVPIEGEKITASIGSILLVPAIMIWLVLDVGVGCAMLTVILPLAAAAEWITRDGTVARTLLLASICFVVGWLFQIVGHVVFERRKPAFLDDLSQMLIGPMFLAAKALVACGWRRDLADVLGTGSQRSA